MASTLPPHLVTADLQVNSTALRISVLLKCEHNAPNHSGRFRAHFFNWKVRTLVCRDSSCFVIPHHSARNKQRNAYHEEGCHHVPKSGHSHLIFAPLEPLDVQDFECSGQRNVVTSRIVESGLSSSKSSTALYHSHPSLQQKHFWFRNLFFQKWQDPRFFRKYTVFHSEASCGCMAEASHSFSCTEEILLLKGTCVLISRSSLKFRCGVPWCMEPQALMRESL